MRDRFLPGIDYEKWPLSGHPGPEGPIQILLFYRFLPSIAHFRDVKECRGGGKGSSVKLHWILDWNLVWRNMLKNCNLDVFSSKTDFTFSFGLGQMLQTILRKRVDVQLLNAWNRGKSMDSLDCIKPWKYEFLWDFSMIAYSFPENSLQRVFSPETKIQKNSMGLKWAFS